MKLQTRLLSTVAPATSAALLSVLMLTDRVAAQDPSGSADGSPSMVAAANAQAAGGGVFIDKVGAIPAARMTAAAALRAKAANRGVIRVIAGLGVSMKAAHDLPGAEAAAQQNTLRATQSSMVSRVLGTAAGEASVTQYDYIPFVAMNVTADQLDRLIADPSVINIQEDVPVPPLLTQSVPFINANDLWVDGFRGKGFAVAVLDTGVDKTHNMFPSGKIASEACYSTKVPGQSTAFCTSGSTAAGSGVNCPHPEVSGCSHGTHVAGIAAGNMTSPVLRGVARSSRIIAIQVFSRFNSPSICGPSAPCALSWTSDQIAALQRVYALRSTFNIASANMSLGGGVFTAPCDSTNAAMKAVIDLLRSARIATVIASGNHGFNGAMSAPACISSAFAVGSTLDASNSLSSFSNHAGNVRLLAPGSNIESSIPPGPATKAIFNGTSMATPHVAGAFALLRDVKGLSTVDDIAAALECTGAAVTRAGITEPRINLNAASNYLLAPPDTTKSFNFNSAAQAAQWAPFIGSWSVNTASPGFYTPAPGSGGWKLSTTANCNENITITSRMRRVWRSGQRDNAGIAFKAQLSSPNRTMHGYMAAFNRDLPGDDHARNVSLVRLDGVNMQTGAGPSALLCNVDLDSITSGTYYTLKVVSRGGLHQVYLDNVLRCEATDHTYGTGRAGVMTFVNTSNPSGNVFRVDSFVINPNETAPTSGDELAAAQ